MATSNGSVLVGYLCWSIDVLHVLLRRMSARHVYSVYDVGSDKTR